jgi:hypothetical protein
MDAIKLRMRAKDQLYPMLQELVTSYSRFKGSKDLEGRGKMVAWSVALCLSGPLHTFQLLPVLSRLQVDTIEWNESLG